MAKTRHQPRITGISIHRVYEVDELALALAVSPVTVRRWLDTGLSAVKDQRPLLIQGGDVIDFKQGRKAAKTPCALNECHCLKCRTKRVPDGNLADYIPRTATTGNLSGFCPECGRLMFKMVSKSKLDELHRLLDLTIRGPSPPIIERT